MQGLAATGRPHRAKGSHCAENAGSPGDKRGGGNSVIPLRGGVRLTKTMAALKAMGVVAAV